MSENFSIPEVQAAQVAPSAPTFLYPVMEAFCEAGSDSALMQQVEATRAQLTERAVTSPDAEAKAQARAALKAYRLTLELAQLIIEEKQRLAA